MNVLSVLFSIFLLQPAWLTDFNQGKMEAAASHKSILLNFSGSDWCGPCIRLKKEIFGSAAFEKYAPEKLVLVNADFPRYTKNALTKQQLQQNETLAEKYNPQGKFPFTVLLTADGKVLNQWEGLPNETPEKFIEEIKTGENAAN